MYFRLVLVSEVVSCQLAENVLKKRAVCSDWIQGSANADTPTSAIRITRLIFELNHF